MKLLSKNNLLILLMLLSAHVVSSFSIVRSEALFGSIHGRVTIGRGHHPLNIDVLPEIFVNVSGYTYNDGLKQNLTSPVDSTGFYSIDSIPVGEITVFLGSDLPPLPLHKLSIEPGEDIKVNFEFAPHIDGSERDFGFDYGVREAQQMWNMGLASILHRSGFDEDPNINVDKVTGLAKLSLQDQHYMFAIGFVEGFNTTTGGMIKHFGMPPYTKRPWLDILTDVPAYFENQKALGKIDTAWMYGPVLFSPDSSYFIMSGSAYPEDLYRKNLILSRDIENNFSEIAWGPQGSHFFIEKSPDKYWNDSTMAVYRAQDYDDWRYLVKLSMSSDEQVTVEPTPATETQFGSLEGQVTFGESRQPLKEQTFYMNLHSLVRTAESSEFLDKVIHTDTSGHYRLDSLPKGTALVTIANDRNYLPTAKRRLGILPDTVLHVDFVLARDFDGSVFEFGVIRGMKQARRDWMVSEALFLYNDNHGKTITVDSKSGLPAVSFGVAKNKYDSGFVAGYNGVIDSLIAEDGLPPNSRKQWLSAIDNPKVYYDKQAALGRVDTLWRFGIPVFSPDSSYCLRYGIDRWLYSYRTDKLLIDDSLPYTPINEFRLIVWGPDKSQFYVEKQTLRSYSPFGQTVYRVNSFKGDFELNKNFTVSQ